MFASEEPAPSDTSSSRSAWGWTATGVGLASVGTGAYFGLQASDSADRYNENGRAADKDSAQSNALGADIAFVVGGALVAVGLYLLLSE